MIQLQHHAYSFWIYIVWARVMVTWFDCYTDLMLNSLGFEVYFEV